jgi:hypothetical protein
VNDQDGGAPGGNIRVGYIFRTDRGLAFIDRPGATSTTPDAVVGTGAATHLAFSPGRIDPNEPNGAWISSRKPLAAEWTYNGHHLFTIANHFNSKLGDESLYGVDQPPLRGSEDQRHKQAPIVNDFVKQIETADPSADIVVLGDLNDFQFSDTLTLLKGGELHTLIDTLPVNEQYTYVFEGNSQAIDHTLLSNHAFASVPWHYDIVHLNSEFADNASDHEPQVTRLYLPDTTAPTVTPPADTTAEATSPSGAQVDYGTCSGTDDITPQADLVYDYSYSNNVTFPLGTTSVVCGATDASGNRGTATFRVNVVDTTPPSIVTAGDQAFEATSSGGAAASYAPCTASDVASTPTIAYSQNAGTQFALGRTTVTCTATDGAGLTAAAQFAISVVDTTRPAISGTATPAPNGAGWNNSPVTVHFTCSDYFLASCTGDVTLSGDGAGQSVAGTATDTSRNSASTTVGGISIDRTAPDVRYIGNTGSYSVDQTVSIICSASDALSGLATNSCANITGPAYTFLGTNTYSATATDRAGNSTTASLRFTVGVATDSLCALTTQIVTNAGIANSLCQKLRNAEDADLRGNQKAANNMRDAFGHEVDAQSGKAIPTAAAELLKRLAAAL